MSAEGTYKHLERLHSLKYLQFLPRQVAAAVQGRTGLLEEVVRLLEGDMYSHPRGCRFGLKEKVLLSCLHLTRDGR